MHRQLGRPHPRRVLPVDVGVARGGEEVEGVRAGHDARARVADVLHVLLGQLVVLAGAGVCVCMCVCMGKEGVGQACAR